MGKDVKKKFTVSLDIDMKDLKKEFKATIGNMQDALANLGNAADKVGYFKDLVGYIGQIDAALTSLRNKNKDAFDSMFDGLDENLRKQLEDLFGTSGAVASQFSVLHDKMNTLTPKSSIKELRKFAKEIDSLFKNIGVDSPFDDIDKQFFGKANAQHIQLLTDALNNFSTVWDGVNDKVKQGFGFGKSSGDNTNPSKSINGISKELQEEIDALKKQQKEIEEIVHTLNNPQKVNVKLSKKASEQVEQLKALKQAFLDATVVKQQFETSNMTGSDAYLTAVADYVKAAAELKSAFESEDLKDSAMNWVNASGLNELNDADKVLGDFLKHNKAMIANIQSMYSDKKSGINNQIEFLLKPYDVLKEKMQEYVKLQDVAQNDDRLSDDKQDKLWDEVDAISKYLISLDTAGDKAGKIKQILNDVDFNGLQVNDAIEQLCNLLNVKIPDAAKKAEDALESIDTNKLVVDSASNNLNSNADAIVESNNKTISAIDYAKKELVKAWQDYYLAVKNAENNGIDVLNDDSTEMKATLKSAHKLYDTWNLGPMQKMFVDNIGPKILGDELDFDDIANHVDSIFDYFRSTGDPIKVSLDVVPAKTDEVQDMVNDVINNVSTEVTADNDSLQITENKVDDILGLFKNLVDYISQSGSTPGKFFDKLESGAQSLDNELHEILQSLQLIDSSGAINLESIKSGFTNQGGFVSDQYTMIARPEWYLPKIESLQPMLAEAQQAGAKIGAIVDIIEDKANGLIYEVQNTVPGTAAFSHHNYSVNQSALNATENQIADLVNTLQVLQQKGLFVDWGGDNVLYDENKGFSIIDLGNKGGKSHTVSKRNTMQENLDRFVSEMFKFDKSVIQSTFVDNLYKMANDAGSNVVNPYSTVSNASNKQRKEVQNVTNKVTASVNAEENAHRQNTDAIDAENLALQAQIDLKKKAQSMKWEAFALDESTMDLKKQAGFQTLSDMEKFWKQANYEKEIDWHEISKHDARKIFEKKLPQGLADDWYGPGKFNVKDRLENEILADDEVRNAALSYLYHLYNENVPFSDKNHNVKTFEDFLNTEFTVYRGDDAPLIYGDESKLSFSFKRSTADGFDSKTGIARIIPKDTIGNAGSIHESEAETFVSSYKTSWFKQTDEKFEDFYNKQTKEMQDEINIGLINLEKQRVQDILGSDFTKLAHKAGKAKAFQNNILQKFQHGIVPGNLDDAGNGDLIDQFASTYNGLSDIGKKLAAYYVSMDAISATLPKQFSIDGWKESSKTMVGKDANLFNTVLNDPTGTKRHVASLTGELGFNLFDRSEQEIKAETEALKQNTQAVQDNAQAKKSFGNTNNDFDITDYAEFDKVNGQLFDISKYAFDEKSLSLNEIQDLLYSAYQTANSNSSDLDNGFISGEFGETYTKDYIYGLIDDVEQAYGENLSFIKNYLDQLFKNYTAKANNMVNAVGMATPEDFNDLDLDDLELDLDDIKLFNESDFQVIKNKLSELKIDANTLDKVFALSDIEDMLSDVEHSTDDESISKGKYFDTTKFEYVDWSEISKYVSDFEAEYQENLDYVHDYLKHMFVNAADKMDEITIELDDDKIEDLIDDDDSIGKYNEIYWKLEALNNGDSKKFDAIAKLQSKIGDISYDVQNNPDIIEQGKFLDGATFKQVDWAEVSDLASDFEVQYGENLDYIHNYLKKVFAKQNEELDQLFSGGAAVSFVENSESSHRQRSIKTHNDVYGAQSKREQEKSKQPDTLDTQFDSGDIHSQDYALESTLQHTNSILGEILSATTDNESDKQSADALNDAVAELNKVASGIVEHQKAQKTDTSAAMARIADPSQYKQISDIAANSVDQLGSEVQIKGLKAIANGLVSVEGAFKNADNEWEGFTVKVNEANKAVDLATNKQSAFAKTLNKVQENTDDVDANVKKYNKSEVEARAQRHLDYYTQQGKNATVQFKDSGRYTITILEEIDGLTKQIFQTFDENDEKIERTTATVSNSQKVKLESLKKLIDTGVIDNTIGDQDTAYKQYKSAADELEKMNALYKAQDDLSNEEILNWNAQIKLVQQLGAAVEKLINQRKNSALSDVFKSDRNKKLSKFDLDNANLQNDIKIPDGFNKQIDDARNAIENAIDNDSLKIAVNNWEALKNEIKQAATEQDLYIQKAKNVNNSNSKKTAYGTRQLQTFTAKYNSLVSGASEVGLDADSKIVSNLTNAYKQLQIAQSKFIAGEDLTTDVGKKKVEAFDSAKLKCNEYARELNYVVTASKKLAAESVGFDSIDEDFEDNVNGRKAALTSFVSSTYGANASIEGFNSSFNELNFTVKNGDGTFTKMTATINEARTAIHATAGATGEVTSKFKSFVNELSGKFKSIGAYFIASFGWQEIWQQVRQGVEYVKEIDSALTELKKVTSETDATYDRFLKSMSKTAGVVGSTVSELTTMAADWARLGYSIGESAKLAESTAILLNVSEFEDATAASEALISTMQAFQYTAEDSQHVVDILNEVGNNYAVSSDGIATALQDSASALMEAGNNLEQSVALVAAANKVVQDPNSVGSALRTISLRLRGTSVEVLEELGEETDGAAESVSKMQAKLKALTGVDILTDSGAYKDTYTILKDIAEVWDDMDSMDQAAALELMAGKNRANTLAAILNNIEDLEGAYESALGAEGSAMRENEAYLDSIQGRIDLFNNALQTLWMNLLDTDVIKGIVDAGTLLLKYADTFTGKLTIIKAALLIFKKFKTGATFAEMFKGAIDNAQKAYASIKSMTTATGSLTKADIARTLASKGVENSLTRRIIAEARLKGVTGALTKEQIKASAETLTAAFRNNELTASQYIATMSTMGLKTALQSLWNVLISNPIMLVAAAVSAAALAFDHFHTTAQEAADAAKEAFDEIQSVVDATKSAIQSLESELSTLQDKIDELNGKNLSFVEDQELEKLKKQKEELEHSLKIQEQLLELQRDSSNKQAVASMKAYTKAASQGAEETQKTAKTWGTIAGVVGGALLAIGGLALTPVSGGTSTALSAAGVSTIASAIGAGAAAGGLAGNKAGEAIGSGIASNEGTYDSWYETYTKALETSRAEEQKALEKYQKDSSNIKKLDKWQEAQQKTADIETEMYEHLSQMQQYFNNLEYGISDEIDKELNEWNNFLDKLSISQEASGAEVTALDRIFGENASEEIQTIKAQILDAISAGEEFDFESAINGSQKLKSTLDYVGLSAEHVKNYFTQIGESAATVSINDEEVNPVDTYSAITESISGYNEILTQTAEILGNNTEVTQEYKDSIIDLIGSEEDVNDCFDDNNKLVVKNAKKLKDLVAQNVKLKKAQHQLDYYSLVRQLNDTLNGTNKLDTATKHSIYSLLDQINTVELAIYQYQQLENSLLGASNAFDEFAKAQEIDSLNTYGDSYTEMVQTMYDAMYKTGQVGTEAFETATEFLVPDHIYKGIKDEADRMKAIYDYFNKNILPSGNLDEDKFSLDYASVEYFVKKGLKSGVFTGNIKDFDLVEGMNLDEAAEKLGYTKAQTYALFAELDKYNTNSTELSFLSQLDDSLDGRITNIANNMEELNRQKLALLEDGGYDKHKTEIDAINQQLGQCEQNLEAASVDAYNMWQEYSNNDVALNALSEIEDKQQKITKEGAATLGLEWDEVKGKTIQQVYDEILAKQQELGVPTELTIQFAQEYIETELKELEQILEDKKIDIEANVVWNEEDKRYETTEGSQYANDEDLQRYVNLQNEGYVLDGYLEDGMTVTEERLSAIQDILQNIYDYQTGKNDVETDATSNTNEPSNPDNIDSSIPGIDFDGIATFFTDTVPEVAGDIGETLKKFFTETVPQEWNEFWTNIGNSFDEFGNEVEEVYGIAKTFFTESIPAAWNEFWVGVGDKISEIGNNAQELYGVISTFFKETIPQKWEEFWSNVDTFLTEDVPYAIGYAAGVVAKFFAVTIPEKWDEFWQDVGEFIENSIDKAEALYNVVEEFITETIPEKWNEFWENVSDFYKDVVNPAIEEIEAALSTFFTETLPTKWNEFWDGVGEFFTETIPNAIENAKSATVTFFTITMPERWNEFWDGVSQFISETIMPALSLLSEKISTFFTVTVPEKWNGFWEAVGIFFTQTIPSALQQLGSKIIEFFTITIPAKWTQFWTLVSSSFIAPIQQGLQAIKTGITTFFTVTLPSKISGLWTNISSWISTKASTFWSNLKSGFTAGFSGGSGSRANGTAHARGTAYKNGSFGAAKTETALVGELGPEMLVRNGRWTTVGDNGAEFTQVKKGDIIFNHKQTEDLLSKGYVTGRGKLKGGNAFASGTAYSGLWNPTSPNKSQSNKPGNDFSDTGNRLFNAADSLSSAADSISNSASDAADEFREVFDWIEVRLEEITNDLNLKSAKLENQVGYSNQNKVIDEMIDLNQKLYDNLIAGANKYYSYANKLLSKVPAEYRKAAQDGTIAIEEFVGKTDEKTLEAIQEYREWVQKGDEAAQQAQETLTEISTLARQAIDNVAQGYENKNSLRENKVDQLEAYNSLIETTDGFESEKVYKQLIKENNKIISNLQAQRDNMQAELNEQVESGNIKKYSQDWYDAVNAIAAVDTEIINLTADTNGYQDAINDLHWEKFDALIGRFEAVSDEADNLIDVLSNKDMVDDNGNWTDEGITSLGLYAQQMEVAEAQAKQYKKEIEDLNKNWQSLGYTEEEYIEKLGELKDGQYDSIQAYYDAKDAIVDLNKERVNAIKDGIQKEIDAYSERIEKKKEELDAEKDLYDFQKSIMEQEKDVADIQRQLAALSGDNSASARAQRAKLEAELAEANANLEESYYERSIQNQQEALDSELENFQDTKNAEMEGWDTYLENTEQVVADSLATIQENTETVYQTLTAMGEEYGLSITEAMTSPWQEGEYAIQSFSEQFGLAMSATVDELTEIKTHFDGLMSEIEQAGRDAVTTVNENAERYTEASKASGTPTTSPATPTTPSTTTNTPKETTKTIKVGGKINAKGAKIYEYAGDKSGSKQYYANDPIYTVLEEKNGYLKVRHHKTSKGVTGWFKKSDVKAYAKGSMKIDEDQWALIDELGPELQLIPGDNGRLEYVKKGTGIVPADLTERLMNLAMDPQSMLDANRPQVGVSPEIHNTEINLNITYGDMVSIGEYNGNNLADIEKMVAKQFEKHTRDLNNALRKYTR